MPTLEVRRHSIRKHGAGSQLSQDHRAWGRTFGPCEGARLTFAGEPAHFTEIEFIRL